MRSQSVVAICALAPLVMGAAQPVRLQPSSQWIVDYAENSCRLIRTFGEGRDKIILSFESEVPESTDMLAIGRPLGSFAEKIQGRFLPVLSKIMEGRTAVSSKGGEPAILYTAVRMVPEPISKRVDAREELGKKAPGTRPPAIPLAQRAEEKAARQAFAAATTEIEIDVRRPVILETGSLGEPIKALDECSRESLRDWGIDPDLEDKIVKPVFSVDPHGWITAGDYPKDMVRQGHESVVKARVLVDAQGHITKCTSMSRFQQVEFNQVVCDRFTKGAKLLPAELADGTKVPSYYNLHVIFQMAN